MYTFSHSLVLPGTKEIVGTGWLPPIPDLRDYTEKHPELKDMRKKLGLDQGPPPPREIDLRKYCSPPIKNQLTLNSCTAHAAIGLVEYFEIMTFQNYIEGSCLFLYKATRNLMKVEGNFPAWMRNTMGALHLCGLPHEKYWPYTDKVPDFDKDPPAFVYSVAKNYEAAKYFCHDPQGVNPSVSPETVLSTVKRYLAAKIPSMFGFYIFPSFNNTEVTGDIPYPSDWEKIQGGHAVVAMGYNDDKKIKNTQSGKETTGALLIRNSWGEGWGEKGYGYLPYDYVLNKLALDFWSLLSMKWVDTKIFGFWA